MTTETTAPQGYSSARKGSIVEAYEGSIVEAYEGSTVYAYEGSTVYACKGSRVYACEGSTVYAYEGSTVYACKGSIVTYPDAEPSASNSTRAAPPSDLMTLLRTRDDAYKAFNTAQSALEAAVRSPLGSSL